MRCVCALDAKFAGKARQLGPYDSRGRSNSMVEASYGSQGGRELGMGGGMATIMAPAAACAVVC
jgi:hypothetical protein